MSEKYAQEFQPIIEKARSLEKPMRVAVAGADKENILKGVFEAEAEKPHWGTMPQRAPRAGPKAPASDMSFSVFADE